MKALYNHTDIPLQLCHARRAIDYGKNNMVRATLEAGLKTSRRSRNRDKAKTGNE
jgi:hypothetical protein